jgi:hypothetical protein
MNIDDVTAAGIESRKKQLKDPAEMGSHIIYRAVPTTVTTFREMDYVTKSRKFANEHAESMYWTEEEPYHVISKVVSNRPNAMTLYNASNPGEYFYAGPEVEGKVVYKATEYEEYQ